MLKHDIPHETETPRIEGLENIAEGGIEQYR